MTTGNGIFPTFFLSGFECSTFLWRDGRRLNLIEATQHPAHALEDYRRLRDLGIGAAREAIPWPVVDQGGHHDFACLDPILAAQAATGVTPIWDLCHYGYPDDLDPFTDKFVERFAVYCRAAADHVAARLPGPYFFTPCNEITYFAFCTGELGWAAPCGSSRQERYNLRVALCRAAIAGVKAILEVLPEARMLHPDPLINVVPPPDRPDLAEVAQYECDVDPFLAWDILSGRAMPELGGAPEVLDIVGPNHYSVGQMEYREHGLYQPLAPGDARQVPLRTLLQRVWERYGRPVVIAETSEVGPKRPDWLRYVMEEALAAVRNGVDLQGVCLFPAVNTPDWHTGAWLANGLFDLVECDGALRREPCEGYLAELHRWQRALAPVEQAWCAPVTAAHVADAARAKGPATERQAIDG